MVISGNMLMMQCISKEAFLNFDLNADILQLSFSFSEEFKMNLVVVFFFFQSFIYLPLIFQYFYIC